MGGEKMANPADLISQLAAAGAQFGYSRSRNHPSTRRHVFGFKNRGAIIDLEQTAAALGQAQAFLRGLGMEGKTLLLIGNKNEARGVIARAAAEHDLPYVAARWLGGTFTNWPQIKSRIDRLADLKTKRDQGVLDRYTKKERLLFDEEIVRLERYFSSLAGLTRLPGAVLVVDSDEEKIAVTEASRVGVPVVSISNTDCDLAGLAYPIVANDASVTSITFLVNQLLAAYHEGQSATPAALASPAVASAEAPAPVTA